MIIIANAGLSFYVIPVVDGVIARIALPHYHSAENSTPSTTMLQFMIA